MIVNNKNVRGFTIVELLVVIVVIGILAALTIVAYTGISSRAMVASLQSDLTNSSKQLKVFQTINSAYPTTISLDCASTPDTLTNKCLKLSPGNTINSLTGDYSVNNTTSPQTFSLTIKNTSSSTIAVVTDSSKPSVLTPAPLSPVADWIATYQGDHYGNFYDAVSHTYATATRATPKTIYDPATQHIYDVPANYLGVNSRSDGKGGSEAVIEEGRTNYLTNSYFSADTNSDGRADNLSYWQSTLPNLPTYSLSSSLLYGNAQRMQLTAGTSTAGAGHILTSQTAAGFAPADTVVFTLWIKGSNTGMNVRLQLDSDTSGGTYISNVDGSTITLTSSWQKVTLIYANLPANTSRVSPALHAFNVDTGDTADISVAAAQVEKGAFATSYIPTTGATVTRDADVVTVPTTGWNSSAGTFSSVASRPLTNGSTLMNWDGTSSWVELYSYNDSRLDYRNATDSDVYDMANSASGYGVYIGSFAVGAQSSSYFNGVGSGAPVGGPATISMPSPSATAQIGGGRHTYSGAPIQRLVAYPSALSLTDVTTVTNAIKGGP